MQNTAAGPAGPRHLATLAQAQRSIEETSAMRAGPPFGIDGAAVKADDANDADGQAVGSGSRFPDGASAFKLPAAERQTVLRKAVREMGRTGVPEPVAVPEPVDIDGSTVTRAILHNPTTPQPRRHPPP
ncbi:hypothetical protein ACFWFZ_04075 [Streptomyces sp. NPDC060232]|uniref:hypothetical protein n=1 Tax=Streptomyces sp. NPDC060232 TaxID=3347079 RepID=UPI003657DBFA